MSSVSSGSARNASSALRMSMRASSPTGRTKVDERPPRGRSMGDRRRRRRRRRVDHRVDPWVIRRVACGDETRAAESGGKTTRDGAGFVSMVTRID